MREDEGPCTQQIPTYDIAVAARLTPFSIPFIDPKTTSSDTANCPYDVQTTSNALAYTEQSHSAVLRRIRRRKETTYSTGGPYVSQANVLVARVKYVLLGP